MSTSGISSSSFSQLAILLESAQQIATDFLKLGSDLKSGNLPAAEQDFVTLSNDALASSSASSTATATSASSSTSNASSSQAQSSEPALEQDFQTLGQDLQSGNLSGAQQAYAQVLQDAQQPAQSSGGHHYHHHASSGGSSNGISQLLQELSEITSASSAAAATSTAAATSGDAAASTTATSTAATATSAASTLPGELSFIQLAKALESAYGSHHHYAEDSSAHSGSEVIQGIMTSLQGLDSTAAASSSGINATA